MSSPHILVVEDDTDIADLIEYNLIRENYTVTKINNGLTATNWLSSHTVDVVLLDRMLPGLDGIEVCKRIRANKSTQHIPIIFLTAKGEETDIVTGLEVGANDYITKPFSPKVLIARIRSLLRQTTAAVQVASDTPIRIGKLTISIDQHSVKLADKPLELTRSEFEILTALAQKPGIVFSRAQIVDQIRGHNYAVSDRAVDVLIVGLRKKMGSQGKMIHTVRGVGYKLQDEK